MRVSKPACWLALLVFTFQASGCYSYRPPEGALPQQPSLQNNDTRYRIRLADDREVEILGLWQDSVSVGGMEMESGESVSFPTGEVREINQRELLRAETTALVVVGIGVLFVGGVAIWAATHPIEIFDSGS
jgi:hypothetical protein